jgi:hypothetical protein
VNAWAIPETLNLPHASPRAAVSALR